MCYTHSVDTAVRLLSIYLLFFDSRFIEHFQMQMTEHTKI